MLKENLVLIFCGFIFSGSEGLTPLSLCLKTYCVVFAVFFFKKVSKFESKNSKCRKHTFVKDNLWEIY